MGRRGARDQREEDDVTTDAPANAFELLLSALQSEAGFTPEQCEIVRAGLGVEVEQ